MTKTEITAQIAQLLQTDDITSIKSEVRDLLANFKAEVAKEKQLQLEAWNAEEHEEGSDFEYTPGPEDAEMDELMSAYRERVKEHGKKIAEEQAVNLKAKEAVLSELEALLKEEENIGKMFGVFNELKEKWDAIGNVPGDKYKEVSDRYQLLREEFFYNINIYKELQENDLKINDKKKQDLIAKVKEAVQMESLREMEVSLRSCQKEWMDIGPSPRETYKAVGDEFFNTCREGFARIQAHYDEIHAEQDQNLEKKKAMVEHVRGIVSLEISNHTTWIKKTEEIIAAQNQWKEIGFARKKDNEEVWQEFRGLCDLFFEKKQQFYNSRKAEQKLNRDKKELLIQKAEGIKNSTDWKVAGDALIKLQSEWKAIGPAAQGDEQRLWSRFRAACDEFFSAKKEHFAGKDDEQKENLRMKKDLIDQIKAYELTGNRGNDLGALKQFSASWKDIGFIPKKHLDAIWAEYKEALDAKYDALKANQSERSVEAYRERVADLSNADDANRRLKKEQYLLRDKIERLNQRVIQYENNMGFFSGKGADAMKKEIERKIDDAKKEIFEIKEKLSILRNDD